MVKRFMWPQARQNFCKLNNKKKPDFLMEEIECKITAFSPIMPYTFGKPPLLEKSCPIEI